ncbi:RNA polymerase sigma factor [Saccharomonospora azurea]|uniref:RNA polymerase sigma factor, sigma-70 family n=1 Tax=Saccharomonospora azurea NA-128 TaxID=882081 RepID=H8G7H3_9PSEU|nr:sigma-70 family RNA polymerase sigma factor [Saccharomonospora azurea]EHK89257.1 RNA polymerase sigma factor [Saccharomonospora azurea SZMC 14600]EHY89368.1 RNA polymerase sigma factor, sigma-70 family [Saccharomonospora azurea NA-128]
MTDARTAEADPSWDGLRGHDLYAACMHAAKAGDRSAMNRLVKELTPLVWQVARGNGLDRHTAEDVVQTVWLALFRNLERIEDPKALAKWLITTARRESRTVAERLNRPVPLTDELAENMPSSQPEPEAEAVRADRDRRIWEAFRRLPDRCQELIRLTVLAGRAEYGLVADVLRMPRGSVGPTRGRCLRRLREALDATEGTADA